MIAGMEGGKRGLGRRAKAERNCIMAILTRFVSNDDGATATEYALMASLIALFIITAVQTVGTKVSTVFTEVGAGLK
jgi:pilus assembly protein Flp/PilA